MAEPKQRKRRLPKAETITFVKEASGDVSSRCRFCNQIVSLRDVWVHVCPNAATGIHVDD